MLQLPHLWLQCTPRVKGRIQLKLFLPGRQVFERNPRQTPGKKKTESNINVWVLTEGEEGEVMESEAKNGVVRITV